MSEKVSTLRKIVEKQREVEQLHNMMDGIEKEAAQLSQEIIVLKRLVNTQEYKFHNEKE